MIIKKIGNIAGGQDGTIFGNELFRFDAKGKCTVFDLSALSENEEKTLTPTTEFCLDKLDFVIPHSNAVFFGTEYYDSADVYPILYTNVYNNYSAEIDKRKGVLCAYRLQKTEKGFKTSLVQMLKIGFCEDAIWKSSEDDNSARPYGNFVAEKGELYAFVMRGATNGTRFFKFRLPSVQEGENVNETTKQFVLTTNDILDTFDLPYFYFIQGATMRDGKIYSTEGFTNDTVNQPAIRVVDPKTKTEEYYNLMKLGFPEEAEMIDFFGDICLYSDITGNLYSCIFE